MINNLFRNFLTAWPTSKAELDETMKSNKKWNEEYRRKNNLDTKDHDYKKNKKSLQVSKNTIAEILLKKLPEELFSSAALLENEYKIEGSVGKGEISEIPWICVFDKDITESAQTGF